MKTIRSKAILRHRNLDAMVRRLMAAENERERRREIIRQVIILALLGAGVIGSAIILFPNW